MSTVPLTLENLFDRTVFLFGAGASMDAGCLSSKGMLGELKTELRRSAAEKDIPQFAAIYDFIIQSLVYQQALKGNPDSRLLELTNVEDFVAVLRQMLDREFIVPPPLIGNWNNKITSWELKNEKIFKEFLDYTYDKLINKWTRFDLTKAEGLLRPIKTLLESHEEFQLSIFSLNYDLVFETVLNTDQEKLVDIGFSQKTWSGDFEDPHSPAKLKLFKLHGSVDWYFDSAEEEVKQGVPEGARPLIVFGSGPKLQSYDPFLSLLANFQEKLRAANLFVVVGYSFQDRYINNILIQNLSSGLNKKMLVIDPGIEGDKLQFIKRIEEFQATRSLNELVSLSRISPASVEIQAKTAQVFFEEYLGDGAVRLKDELSQTEEGERVF